MMLKKNSENFLANLLLLLGFVIFLNLFFFNFWGPVAFVLILWGFFIFLISLLWQNKLLGKNRKAIIITLICLIIVSLFTVIRANVFVSMVVYLTGVGIVVLYAAIVKDRIPFVRSLFELLILPFNFGLSYLEGGLKFTIRLFSEKSQEKTNSSPKGFFNKLNLPSIAVGLLIGLPVVAILLGLLSLADPIFATFIRNIFKPLADIFRWINWQRFGDRLILSLIVFLLFSPSIYFFSQKKSFYLPKIITTLTFTREALIVMFLVALTLGLFIFVQWPYIFARVPYETDLSKFGVATYSEYVKKGFIELLLTSAVIYSLVWISFLALRVKNTIKRPFLFYLQILVFGEFFLILFSIARRIYLYQAYHGWSLGRIYGSFFLVWILIITITLLLRHFIKAKWVRYEVIATGIIVLILGLFNAEEFIVNNHPPTVNRRIDYIYLSRMSPDGYSGWKSAYNYALDILLNQQWESKIIINREERREVAYAGIIVNRLTIKYHQLLNKYAAYKEQKEYYHEILQNRLNNLGFCPDSLTKNQQAVIIDKLNYIESSSVNLEEVSKRLSLPRWNPSFLRFDNKSCMNTSFYEIVIGNPLTNVGYTNFEKFLSWNFGENNTYKQMKNDMNIKNLLILQNQFNLLFKKIANQPPGERDFDIDVSFRSPFL